MSDRQQLLHRAIQSYNDTEVEALIARLAQASRYEQEPIEQFIIEVKQAVNSLPISALRDRARTELRDALVSVAITAYYEGAQPPAQQFASERHQSH